MNVVAGGVRGNADLIGYFVLRSTQVAVSDGLIGLLATNTLTEGDTREVSLDRLIAEDWRIVYARSSQPWPGAASLEFVRIVLAKRWTAAAELDGSVVKGLSSQLTPVGRVAGQPKRLAEYATQSFVGVAVQGSGFILEGHEANDLFGDDPNYGEVVWPYLNGDDLNRSPHLRASRWIINFFDWSVEEAQKYPRCYRIVEERVKPYRQTVNRKAHRERWWQYGDRRPAMFEAILGLDRVLVVAQVSNTLAFEFVNPRQVLDAKLIVFPYSDIEHYGLLNSSIHAVWSWRNCTTLGSSLTYGSHSIFDTFVQPQLASTLSKPAEMLRSKREEARYHFGEGATEIVRRVGSPDDRSAEIVGVREALREVDRATMDAYGWSDLEVRHAFVETRFGRRYTLEDELQATVYERLLELNFVEYASEVERGLHGSLPVPRLVRDFDGVLRLEAGT